MLQTPLFKKKLKSKFEAGNKEQTDDAVQDALGRLDKIEVGHKEKTEEAVQNVRNCLDKNPWEEKHEFEAKQKGSQYL